VSGPRSRGAGPLAAALLVAASLLAACRTVGPAEPALPPLPAEDPRPAAFLTRLVLTAAERTSLRAGARVVIEGERRSSFAKQLLLLERPARLRLEIVGLLGQRVAVLATDGARYDLYRAERPTLESGEVHAGILWDVAGLALTPEEAVQLALGSPLLPSEGTPPVASAAELPDGGLRLVLRSPRESDPRRTLEFDAAGELRRYEVRAPSGELVFEARYGDYRDLGGSPFAYAIEVELPATKTHAEIQFQWVELNPTLTDDLFRLELRRGGALETPWRRSAS
jgi:hypothetical protein